MINVKVYGDERYWIAGRRPGCLRNVFQVASTIFRRVHVSAEVKVIHLGNRAAAQLDNLNDVQLVGGEAGGFAEAEESIDGGRRVLNAQPH